MNVELNSNGVNKLIKAIILSDENWFYPHNGWHKLFIEKGMTFEKCKDKLPKIYGV